MSKVSKFHPIDSTYITDHRDVDGCLYLFDNDLKRQNRIDNSEFLLAGNRVFHSFSTGSDGTALRLSFDGTTYQNVYVMCGGLHAHHNENGSYYKADGAMILYCVDASDQTITAVKKIILSDNTNAWTHEGDFVTTPNFLGASSYVTLDDDHTSAILVNCGSLSLPYLVEAGSYSYEYIQDYDTLKENEDDMTLYDIHGVNTGWVIIGYGGRNSNESMNYGWKYDIRNKTSHLQNEFGWAAISGFAFGCHRGSFYFYGDNDQNEYYYNQRMYEMRIYSRNTYTLYGTGDLPTQNGYIFGWDKNVYKHAGGSEYGGQSYLWAYDTQISEQDLYLYFYGSNTPKRDKFAGVLHPVKARAYFFGGVDENGTIIDSVQVYDISTNTMIELTPIPVPIVSHTATLVDNCVYIIGGRIGDTEYNTKIYEYNIELDSWSVVKTGIRPRSRHAAAEYDGTIFLIGGVQDEVNAQWSIYKEIDIFIVKESNSYGQKYADMIFDEDFSQTESENITVPDIRMVEYGGKVYMYGCDVDLGLNCMIVYDPATNIVNKLAENPFADGLYINMAAYDGTIFVTGGQDSTASNRMIAYIIEEDLQQEGPNMPGAHMYPKMLAYDNTIWVRTPSKELYAFDVTANEQSTLSIGLVARTNFGFVVYDNTLWVFGGQDGYHIGGYFHPMTDIETYDISTDTQSIHSTMYQQDGFVETTYSKEFKNNPFVKDGKIWLFGGRADGGYPMMTTEVFDPATGTYPYNHEVFGGGDFHDIQSDDWRETIGSFIINDKLYVFYSGINSPIGIYTFTPQQSSNVIDSYEEIGFIDSAAFSIVADTWFLDTSTQEYKQIYGVNPYPPKYAHQSVKLGASKILSTGGALSRDVARLDQLPLLSSMILETTVKNMPMAIDYVLDATTSDNSFGLEQELSGKENGWDFGVDNTAGIDGQYARINIDSSIDMTNIVFEVAGGSVTRLVAHYPGSGSAIIDENGLPFPVDADLIGMSNPGPICVYLRIPEGTVIKHVQATAA